MLEIVFDESPGNIFLGQKYKSVALSGFGDDFAAYRKTAAALLSAHGHDMAVLIDFSGSPEERNLLALALSIETYAEKDTLESAVFKVSDSAEAMALYKPYMALANSLRYARDLYRMNEDEMYADIKRLGYLGLKIEEDYLKGEIKIVWGSDKGAENLRAEGKADAIIVTGFMKTTAICRYKSPITAVLIKNGTAAEKSEDEIINEIIMKVRKENAKR